MLPRLLSHPYLFSNANTGLLEIDQGQGANQAIEDAGALGVFLSNVHHLTEVPRYLELFQNIRRERAAAMQIFSNAGQDQANLIEKEAQKYIKGPVPSKCDLIHLFLAEQSIS